MRAAFKDFQIHFALEAYELTYLSTMPRIDPKVNNENDFRII